MQATAGSEASFIESIQNTFDNLIRTSLNTGPVQLQKLSGQTNDSGVFHIFYYDDEGRVCSSEGTDQSWSITDNF